LASSAWRATSTASEIAIRGEPVGARLRAAGLGQSLGGAVDRRAPGLDHRAPVGLLVVADADHEDLALEPNRRQASASAEPHWPAPVSVTSFDARLAL
jgi:hypothetical protein